MRFPCSRRESRDRLRNDAVRQLKADGAQSADEQAKAVDALLATLPPEEEKIMRMLWGISADTTGESCPDRSISGALIWIWSRISQGLPLNLPKDKKTYTLKELGTLLRGSR